MMKRSPTVAEDAAGRIRVKCITAALVVFTVAYTMMARAHVESFTAGDGGFISGLLHPVTGLDHVVAMIAVGLWGAVLGAPAIWLLPIAFPLIMTVGAVMGVIGLPLPGIDIGIAVSGVVLGLMVVINARPPLIVAMLIVSVFAIFHGHPHGSALPDYGVPALYAVGFVLATGLLHLSGIVLGLLYRWPTGRIVVKSAGIGIAIAGLYFLFAAAGITFRTTLR